MGKLIQLLAKHGSKAVDWAWKNSQRVMQMLSRMSPEEVARIIGEMFL